MNGSVGAVVVEFGGRGDLSDKTIAEMKNAPAMVAAAYPGKPLMVSIGGYDDDPRELWNIPEVATYIRRYAKASGLDDWTSPLFTSLVPECKALLIQCNAINKPHPFTVKIGS